MSIFGRLYERSTGIRPGFRAILRRQRCVRPGVRRRLRRRHDRLLHHPRAEHSSAIPTRRSTCTPTGRMAPSTGSRPHVPGRPLRRHLWRQLERRQPGVLHHARGPARIDRRGRVVRRLSVRFRIQLRLPGFGARDQLRGRPGRLPAKFAGASDDGSGCSSPPSNGSPPRTSTERGILRDLRRRVARLPGGEAAGHDDRGRRPARRVHQGHDAGVLVHVLRGGIDVPVSTYRRASSPARARSSSAPWRTACTLEVRATDAAGNLDPTPASRTFTVDTLPPDPSIDDGPEGVTTTRRPRSSSPRTSP